MPSPPRPASPTPDALMSAWRVPYPRNLHFTGRDSVLASLRRRLGSSDALDRAQVVCGPGGIGKTQTLLEYAHRFREAYKVVWWISADDPAGVVVALTELARALGLEATGDGPPIDLRRRLFRHLAGRDDWLLIFNDAPDAESLQGALPTERTGHVLISSRNPEWLSVARVYPLGVFTRDESRQFLLRRTGRNEEPQTVDQLAEALGDMPLALDQAAALIGQTRIAFADYLRRFETHWGELLRARRTSADYPMSVAMTWDLAFKQVEEQHPRAADVLSICLYLSPESIPRQLLRDAASHVPDTNARAFDGHAFEAHALAAPAPVQSGALASVLSDALSCGEAIGQLARYSLVDTGDRVLRIHPLASALGRERLSIEERRTWASVAARTVASTFAFDGVSMHSWRGATDLLPHALAAGSHADALGVAPEAVRSLYNHAGLYLLCQARYDRARRLLERAAMIALRLWGPDSPRMSPIANNLGRLHLRTGNLALAREQFEQALRVDETVYGAAHPHVAELINNRGVCRHGLGDVDGAEQDFKRALDIYQLNFGPDHAKIASILNNLGYAQLCRGDVGAARAQLSVALRMAQTTLGVSHPTVAAVLRNMGMVCRATRQLRDARLCFEKALDIDAAVLGQTHPDTGADLAGLGEVFEELGESELARNLLERAVTIEETHFGVDHARLAPRLRALARSLLALGHTRDADALARRAEKLDPHLARRSQ